MLREARASAVGHTAKWRAYDQVNIRSDKSPFGGLRSWSAPCNGQVLRRSRLDRTWSGSSQEGFVFRSPGTAARVAVLQTVRAARRRRRTAAVGLVGTLLAATPFAMSLTSAS